MPQFIHEQFIEDVGLADKFVAHFHNNPQNHSVGKTEGLEGPEITYFKKSWSGLHKNRTTSNYIVGW